MVLVSYRPIIFVSRLAIVMDFLQAGRKCERLCRKFAFLRSNQKIGYQKINDLRD